MLSVPWSSEKSETELGWQGNILSCGQFWLLGEFLGP